MARSKNREALAWGIVLVAVGAVFLFNSLGIGIWDVTARLWPLILVFWGAWKLYFGLKDRRESRESAVLKDQP
jgi:hypothetical protein